MHEKTPDKIEKTIELAVPIARVWRALTDHEEFGAWFMVKLDRAFAVGAEATGHITNPGYEHVAWRARVTAMDEPHYFAFTWHPYGIDKTIDYSTETPTLVAFQLAEIPRGTRLTLTESGFDKIPARRMPEAFRMNDNGWTIQMQNIKNHVGG
jgi:uncharacterized protein YndB with AHSA1/START domain